MSKLVDANGKEVKQVSKYKIKLEHSKDGEHSSISASSPLNISVLFSTILGEFHKAVGIDVTKQEDIAKALDATKEWSVVVTIDPPIEIPEDVKAQVKAAIAAQAPNGGTVIDEEFLEQQYKEWHAKQDKPYAGPLSDVLPTISKQIPQPTDVLNSIGRMFNGLLHSSSLVFAHTVLGFKLPGSDKLVTTDVGFTSNYIDVTTEEVNKHKEESKVLVDKYLTAIVAPDIIVTPAKDIVGA